MTTHKEALTLALDALSKSDDFLFDWHENESDNEADAYATARQLNEKAITAIKEALAQQEQSSLNPLWLATHPDKLAQPEQETTNLERHERNVQKFLGTQQPKEPEQDEYLSKAYRLANELRCHLSIAPAPQRTWVGLTDEEMHECAGEYPWTPTGLKCCRAIEAKLKEKNT